MKRLHMLDLHTLVSYRPNGVNMCSGWAMHGSDSDFDIDTSDDPNALALAWGEKLYQNDTREKHSAVCSWEFTLMTNGDKDGNWTQDGEWNDLYYEMRQQIETKAYAVLNQLMAENKQKKELRAKKAEEDLRAANERTRIEKEKQDRRDYDCLKAKFENQPKTCEE